MEHDLTADFLYWAHKTSLTLPLFIEVSVPNQESEMLCMCVSDIDLINSVNSSCSYNGTRVTSDNNLTTSHEI
jgi:hypothetical protein